MVTHDSSTGEDGSFELRFRSASLRPEGVRSRELSEVLQACDEFLTAAILAQAPDVSKDDLIVGLVGIAPGSVCLTFRSTLPSILDSSVAKIATSIKAGTYSSLPRHSVNGLQVIQRFAHRHTCDVEFRLPHRGEAVLAALTPETEIPAAPRCAGMTALYGRVLRVGGRTTPRVMLQTTRGDVVYCDTSEEIARKLGERLYSSVGVVGRASWYSDNLEVESFRVERVLGFSDRTYLQVMGELTTAVGKHYSEVSDVVRFVADMRNA